MVHGVKFNLIDKKKIKKVTLSQYVRDKLDNFEKKKGKFSLSIIFIKGVCMMLLFLI